MPEDAHLLLGKDQGQFPPSVKRSNIGITMMAHDRATTGLGLDGAASPQRLDLSEYPVENSRVRKHHPNGCRYRPALRAGNSKRTVSCSGLCFQTKRRCKGAQLSSDRKGHKGYQRAPGIVRKPFDVNEDPVSGAVRAGLAWSS